jgi:hypothetical protein
MEKKQMTAPITDTYFMKGTDTIHTEKILLQQVEDELAITLIGSK